MGLVVPEEFSDVTLIRISANGETTNIGVEASLGPESKVVALIPTGKVPLKSYQIKEVLNRVNGNIGLRKSVFEVRMRRGF